MSNKKGSLIALVYTITLFYLSLRSIPPEIGSLFSYQDKLMHLAAYTLLMTIYLFTMPIKGVAFILSIGIGIIIEHLQPLTGIRFYEIGDIGANSLGVILGIPLHHYLKTYFPNQTSYLFSETNYKALRKQHKQ